MQRNGLALVSVVGWLAATPVLFAADTAPIVARAPFKAHEAVVRCVVFDRDNKTLFSSGEDGTAKQWQLGKPEPLHVIAANRGTVGTVAVSPDGTQLVTSGSGALRLWDPKTWREERMIETEFGILHAAFSRDGRRIASSHFMTDEAYAWDAADGKKLATLTSPTRPGPLGQPGGRAMGFLDFSPDGKYLAVCMAPGHYATVPTLFNAETFEVRARFVAHAANRSYSIAFSPDSQTLAFGTMDGLVKLFEVSAVIKAWDARKVKSDEPLEGLQPLATPAVKSIGGVRGVAFSPDGRWLAAGSMKTGGPEGLLTVWRTTDLKKPVFQIKDHPVNWLAFSPDSKLLATALSDGNVGLFDVR